MNQEKIDLFLNNRAEYYKKVLMEVLHSYDINKYYHCEVDDKKDTTSIKIVFTKGEYQSIKNKLGVKGNSWVDEILSKIFTNADEIIQQDFDGYNFKHFLTDKDQGVESKFDSLHSYLSPLVGFWINYDLFKLKSDHRSTSPFGDAKIFPPFTYNTDNNKGKHIHFNFRNNNHLIWYEKDCEDYLNGENTLQPKDPEKKETNTYFYSYNTDDNQLKFLRNFQIVEREDIAISHPINGAMRADEVEDNYCWTGNQLFGIALGLMYDSEHYQTEEQWKEKSNYCQTNTPWDKGNLIRTKFQYDMESEIQYYRKKSDDKLKKSCQKNKPKKPKLPVTYNNNEVKAFKDKFKTGKKEDSTKETFRKKKKGTRDEENGTKSGENLEKSQDKRDSAGDKMGEYLLTKDKKLKKSDNTDLLTVEKKYLSANQLRDAVLGMISSDGDVKEENNKTDQEWCHLLGHGDGGLETSDNFVSGSKHCNTEQLAIEAGQRIITHKKPNEFKAKITAYLMKKILILEKIYQK